MPNFNNLTIESSSQKALQSRVANEPAEESDSKLGSAVDKIDGIPGVIMQTMVGPGSDEQPIPDWVRQKWTTLNPQFTYKFFNDADAREFLVSHYSADHLDLFDRLKENKYKADLFRYCYLYQYGGIYADIDMEPLVQLDDFLHPSTKFFTVWSGHSWNGRHLCQGYIAVTPKHPIMKRAIEQMLTVGTSFETIGAPFLTHPTNQLYEIVNDILPSHSVNQGLFDTDVGGIQLAIERCPSYQGCFVEYNATTIANTRYKEWTGQGWSVDVQEIVDHSYRKIHDLFNASDPQLCAKTHVLKGDNDKEPDVHVCLSKIPPTGCVVYSIGTYLLYVFIALRKFTPTIFHKSLSSSLRLCVSSSLRLFYRDRIQLDLRRLHDEKRLQGVFL